MRNYAPAAVVAVPAGIGPWDTGPAGSTAAGWDHRREEAVPVAGRSSCGGRRTRLARLDSLSLVHLSDHGFSGPAYPC